MKRLVGLTTAIALTTAINTAAYAGAGAHWGYNGSEGPQNWAQLSSAYQMCAQGQHQSPVNISKLTPYSATTIETRYRPSTLYILNNGHTVQENFIPGSGMVSNGHEYELIQLHFHTPAEHAISGKRYPLEAHFVHADAENKLAVVGVFFEVGDANPELAKIIAAAPQHAEPTRRFSGIQVNPTALLPANLDAYNYMGSLTTPPCTEEVNWHVVKQVMTASMEQIEAIHTILGDNARPIQHENASYTEASVIEQVAAYRDATVEGGSSMAHGNDNKGDDHRELAVAPKGH